VPIDKKITQQLNAVSHFLKLLKFPKAWCSVIFLLWQLVFWGVPFILHTMIITYCLRLYFYYSHNGLIPSSWAQMLSKR
jgi:hypothetical protein